jgi:hypothetical protein
MINYGRILKQKEKDNPSPFCRASYLFSNVGDLVYCYGRSIRFPQLRKAYEGEMELALGDIIMQCRLIEEENDMIKVTFDGTCHNINGWLKRCNINNFKTESLITDLVWHTANYMQYKIQGEIDDCLFMNDITQNIQYVLWYCRLICEKLDWNFDEISHLGFQHVMERFEQFERDGWE